MVKAEAGNPSILTQPKLLFAMAANIFSQRERRRDHSHLWSQEILESLVIGKFSFITTFLTQHLSTLPWTSALQANISIEWLIGEWNFASEIHVIQAPGRIERLTRQLSFVAEILLEPTAVRHQPSEVLLLHRDAPPVLATVWLLHWFCYLSIQDC